LGMIRRQVFLSDFHRAPEKLLCLCEMRALAVDLAQLCQSLSHDGVVGAQQLLANRECAAKQLFRFSERPSGNVNGP